LTIKHKPPLVFPQAVFFFTHHILLSPNREIEEHHADNDKDAEDDKADTEYLLGSLMK
jgi:hypothetical protein